MTSLEHPLAYSPTLVHKGMQNSKGENNCFLNVVIQALWHLGPFRHGIKKIIQERSNSSFSTENPNSSESTGKESEDEDHSLLTALVNLFINYEFTELQDLPPNELRISLSSISDKFQIGNIADANEAMEQILSQLHSEIQPQCPGNHTCLPHTVFSGVLMEQTICIICGATSEPELKSDFLHTIYALEMISLAKQKNQTISSIDDFGWLVRRSIESTQQSCPSTAESPRPKSKKTVSIIDIEKDSSKSHPLSVDTNPDVKITRDKAKSSDACTQKAHVKCFCLEPPLALALSVVWTSSRESPAILSDFIDIIGDRIILSDLFVVQSSLPLNPLPYQGSNPSSPKNIPSYAFRGFVCYYGLHYVTIFQEYLPGSKKRKFLLFDDKNIRPIGDWNDVKRECVKSHYQPVLLLYELENSHQPEKFRPFEEDVKKLAVRYEDHHNNNNIQPSWWNSLFGQGKHDARHRSDSKIAQDVKRSIVIDDIKRRRNRKFAEQKWGYRYKRKEVTLSLRGQHKLHPNSESLLAGLQFETDINNQMIVIIAFIRHPTTNEILPAEESGQIDLMDKVFSIQGINVIDKPVTEVVQMIRTACLVSNLQLNNFNLTLSLESGYNKDIWYLCDHCGKQDIFNETQEQALHNAEIDGSPNFFIECSLCGKLNELNCRVDNRSLP